MEQLFSQLLVLAARAGLGELGQITLDGTKIAADAPMVLFASSDRGCS